MTDIWTDCLTWVVAGQTLAMNDQLALGPVVGDPTQVFTLVQGTNIQYLTVASQPGMAMNWQTMEWGTAWDDPSSPNNTWYQAAAQVDGLAFTPAAFFAGANGAIQVLQPNAAGTAVVMGPLPAGMSLTTPPAYTPPTNGPSPSAYVPSGYLYAGGDEMANGFNQSNWWTLYANPSTAHSIPSNGEMEYYDVNGNHVAISGGGVALTALPPGSDGLYHSGMLRAKQTFDVKDKAVYIEVKAKIPNAQGAWPVPMWFAAEPTNPDGSAPWPPELDVAEFMINSANGDTSSMVGMNVQFNGNVPGPWNGGPWSYDPPPTGWTWSATGRTKWITPIDFSAEYNIFGVLMTPISGGGMECNYYVNGYRGFFARYDAYVGADGTQPYNLELLIDLAVGGVGGGTPNPSEFPCSLDIAYVRWYTTDGSAPGPMSTIGVDEPEGPNGW